MFTLRFRILHAFNAEKHCSSTALQGLRICYLIYIIYSKVHKILFYVLNVIYRSIYYFMYLNLFYWTAKKFKNESILKLRCPRFNSNFNILIFICKFGQIQCFDRIRPKLWAMFGQKQFRQSNLIICEFDRHFQSNSSELT